MKKAILSLLLFLVCSNINAQTISLSQSNNPNLIDEDGPIFCWEVTPEIENGASFDNYFARVYDLEGDHDIEDGFLITAVEIGQFYGNSKIIDVNIYETDNLDPNLGDKILLATESVLVIPQANESVLVVSTSALIQPGKKAFIEVFTPSEPEEIGSIFVIGKNSGGQIRQSWFKSISCGIDTFIDPSSLGGGPQEYVLNINGEVVVMSTQQQEAESLTLYPNPTTDFIHLKKPNTTIINKVKVLDLTGKVIIESGWSDQIDISSLSAGKYMVQFYSETGVFTKNVVKH